MNIYVNSITNAVVTLLSSWETGINSGWYIADMDEININSNLTPWIGVFPPTIVFDPARANIITPFMASIEIPIIAQTSNFKDHFESIKDLQNLTGEVYTAVSCYRNLLNTVNIVKQISWEPSGFVLTDKDNLTANQLTIIAEVFA